MPFLPPVGSVKALKDSLLKLYNNLFVFSVNIWLIHVCVPNYITHEPNCVTAIAQPICTDYVELSLQQVSSCNRARHAASYMHLCCRVAALIAGIKVLVVHTSQRCVAN